jgi:DNA or RNA helicases of superfamily II
MVFKFIKGKNFLDFVLIDDINTKDDVKLYNDVIKKTLNRKEFNPYKKGFNKTITYSYLFNEYIFPYQFWFDVKKSCEQIINKELELVNDPLKSGYYRQIDREYFNTWVENLVVPEDINLDDEDYEYQQDAVFNAINHRTCRCEIATGGGKTFITYMYCKWLIENIRNTRVGCDWCSVKNTEKCPSNFRESENSEKCPYYDEYRHSKQILIVVPSKLLCNQLKEDFRLYDKYNNSKIWVETIYSGSKKLIGADCVVGTFQSLSNYDEEYFDNFFTLICDELHRAKSYSIRSEIYAKMKFREFCFGMTGTYPEYNTLDYLHITAMFGTEVENISARALMDTGVLNEVIVHNININYYSCLKKEDIPNSERISKITEVLNEGIVGTEKYMAEKQFYHNNYYRTEIIAKLLNGYKENAIIFTDTVEYCNILYENLTKLCPEKQISIIHGKITDREDIIQDMKNNLYHRVIIGTYGTMSTGISIKNLTNGFIVDAGKSRIRIRQTVGRLTRILENKPDSKVFDFCDNINGSTFKKHAQSRLKIYKTQKFQIITNNVKIPAYKNGNA